MTTKRRNRHSPDQIVRKLRDADAMLNARACCVFATARMSELRDFCDRCAKTIATCARYAKRREHRLSA